MTMVVEGRGPSGETALAVGTVVVVVVRVCGVCWRGIEELVCGACDVCSICGRGVGVGVGALSRFSRSFKVLGAGKAIALVATNDPITARLKKYFRIR